MNERREITWMELIEWVNKGAKHVKDVHVKGGDGKAPIFARVVFSVFTFENVGFDGVNFSGTSLNVVIFSGCDFFGCGFSNAPLGNCKFQSCSMHSCDFRGCPSVKDTIFIDCDLQYAHGLEFDGNLIRGGLLPQTAATITGFRKRHIELSWKDKAMAFVAYFLERDFPKWR